MKVFDTNGNYYEGEGSADQSFHGQGKLVLSNGHVKTGLWDHGRFLGDDYKI